MRNAASIARGALSEISAPTIELTSRLTLMTPSPIVTGSMRMKTRLTPGSRQFRWTLRRKSMRPSTGTTIASWTIVPSRTPIAYA